MNKVQSMKEFLATQGAEVNVSDFIINLLLAGTLAYFLGLLYKKYGVTLSNRDSFSRNFMMLTMTTMLIITIVKSSLALSLGLVGALSIVRFRAAIKEPEELSYLFLAIAIGLGLGANQRVTTLVAFFIIVAIIFIRNLPERSNLEQSLNLIISTSSPGQNELDKYVEILKKNFLGVKLIRIEDSNEMLEASFLVEIDGYQNIKQSTDELKQVNSSLSIVFLDNKGLV